MRNLLLIWMIMGLAGPAFAAEKLGPDGFPVEWGAEDFSIAAGQVSETGAPANTPKTFRIDQLQRVSVAPSGTTPIALPPVMNVTNTYEVSKTYYKPLAAAFDGGEAGAPTMSGVRMGSVSDTKSLTVDASDIAAYGVLDAGSGGLAKDVWISSVYANAGAGVALLGNTARLNRQSGQIVADMALREGWRRLLLSSATPPTLQKDKNGEAPNWLAVRASLLEKLGMYESAWSLWRVITPEARAGDEDLAQGWVRANLLAGESRAACSVARERAAARAGGWWTVAVASCAAIEATQGGNANALGLSLQLIPNDQGLSHKPLVGALMAVRDGGQVSVSQVRGSPWEGLAGAVVAAYPSVISTSDIGLLPDVALRRLRDSATLPGEVRLPAARALATQTGWVQDGAVLVRLVSGGVIGDTTPDAAVVAWARDHTGKDDEPAMVVKAALRLGENEVAQAWWPRWRGVENLSLETRRQRLQVQLGLEAGGADGVSDTTLGRWLASQELNTTAGATQAQRVLLAVEGLGKPVSDTVWADYRGRAVKVDDGADAAWRRVLAKAVKAHDVPQVLSLVTEGFAGRQAPDVPPGVVGDSVAALGTVGLHDVAVRMVAEVVTADKAMRKVSEVPGVPVSASTVSVSATVPEPKAEGEELLPPPRVSAPVKPKAPVAPRKVAQ